MPNRGNRSIDMKKMNRNRIFRLIYREGQLSKQNIVHALGISLPTVTQNLKILKEMELIKEQGSFASTGGRKARALCCNPVVRFSIGVDITRNHLVLVAIDLCATIIKNKRVRISFEDTKPYYKAVGELIEQFIHKLDIDKTKILGVGISVPGLLTEDHQRITYASVLGFSGGDLSSFTAFIPYPCILSNDASAAGLAELWNREEADNVVYLSLSNSVGGAILLGKKFYAGDNHRSAEFGHMTIVPGGKRCYCGQYGCVDAYCNAQRLSDSTNGSLSGFFTQLGAGSVRHQNIWNEYLHYLALSVNNLRMLFDCKIILGGYVGSYMEKYVEPLRKQTSMRNSFEKDGSYLKVCRYKMEASAVGAALLHIEPFINRI